MDKISKKEFNEKSKKWFKEKFDNGWRETCMGFLSPDDIKASGMKFDKTLIQEFDKWRPRGYCSIPTEMYIVENNGYGQSKGTKCTRISSQFTRWQQDYYNRQYNKKSLSDYKDDENVNVDEINF